MSADEARRWIRDRWGMLAADAKGLLALDPDASVLGIAIDEPSFFAKAAACAGEEATARQAVALLARRIPEGPGAEASCAEWGRFLEANGSFLFFTETGGYVWLLDPLAKERGVPSRELRGVRRAG
jgi:hypothetical protein